MLQDTRSRIAAVSAFSLFITILMYLTLSRVRTPSQMVEEAIWSPTIYSAWGDGWSSLFQAGGQPFEGSLLRSANGDYAFSMSSVGELVYEDRKKKKNTTIFGPTAEGVHGIEEGEAPGGEGVVFHTRLSRRGTLVVFYERVYTPNPETNQPVSTDPELDAVGSNEQDLTEILSEIGSRTMRSSPLQRKQVGLSWDDILRRIEEDHDADEGEKEEDHNHDIGSLSNVIWDSNKLPDCHKIPRGAYPPSIPFMQLDDNGALYISTMNEINCVLKAAQGS